MFKINIDASKPLYIPTRTTTGHSDYLPMSQMPSTYVTDLL